VTDERARGTVAVVTGGASGIGYALAKAYGERGAVVLLADRDDKALATACATLTESGIETHTQVVDVRDAQAVTALGARATSIGPIGAACLNAGVSAGGSSVWATSRADYDFAFGVNLWGLFNSVRALVPLVVEQGRPADVVITTSLAGLISLPSSGPYTVSKTAAVALAKVLRVELAEAAPEVRVACLAPAQVRTNLAHTTAAQRLDDPRMTREHVEQVHSQMNARGAPPDVVAGWVMDALDDGRFWVLSPADDPFMQILATEIAELTDAMHDGAPS
jgi:NAD(P)-dependent dehydrogenase (short-subunit alcohol dehydrogenase family)